MVRTILTAAILSALPILAVAECGHERQAMSCAEGMVLDQETGTCVASATS
ncbi:hypothetical protein [Wenxinia marina]|uniref:Adenylosuccinate lyase n=1 Tax=Wenxinia marina DSM 24838 TaxID=1123501 RepID=A0A0D0NKX6_9RHOB|nr:hypothetical protein [Wenxinia marina]KIQ68965.1 hypothetical protein Wenmar_02698 [Wenxinia marina DSM 24838]GGL63685.1 hypothetical protein GCM10011392_18060 [Wenxinia marina]